ncbi:hypothetical protein ACFE04_014024 [Oxalis oulophora]
MSSSHIYLLLSTTLLLILVDIKAAARSLPNPNDFHQTDDTEFIKTSCSLTIYPDLCFATLSTYAFKIQSNPKLLALTSLNLTLDATSTMFKNLSKTHYNFMSPREAAAMKDCVEETKDSVDELRNSISEMSRSNNKGKSEELLISDVQTWVSAALTDEDTCMDGFYGKIMMNGNLKNQIVNVAHMTSNSLALVNFYASSRFGLVNSLP